MAKHLSDELLSRYADGDLNQGKQRQVSEHLEVCVSCSDRLAQLIAIRDLAGDLETLEPPQGMLAGIKARIEAEEEAGAAVAAPRRRGLWYGIIFGTAAAIVIALLVFIPHVSRQQVTPEIVLDTTEIIGPPVGLAYAREFGADEASDEMDTVPLHVVEFQSFSEDSFIKVLLPRDSGRTETLRLKLDGGVAPPGPWHKLPERATPSWNDPRSDPFQPVKDEEGKGKVVFP